MNRANPPPGTAMPVVSSSTSDTRLRGRWLVLARLLWGVVAILTLVAFVTLLPVYVTLLRTVCASKICPAGRLTPTTVYALSYLGFTPDLYVAWILTLTLVFAVVSCTIGGILVWRKSHDRMALLTALMLILLSTATVTQTVGESQASQAMEVLLLVCLNILTIAAVFLVFSLFPDGRFVPRWTLWLILGFTTWRVLFITLPNVPFSDLLDNLAWFGSFVSLAGAQIYRYRSVSGPLERQQTKWVVFGFSVTTLVGILPNTLLSSLIQPGSLFAVATDTVFRIVFLLIPLSFGMAILRYRLYDIDIIINRTLVYGTLTGTLALVYVGLVIGLSALLRGIISQDNSIAIVISTLAIAALFQQLRHRLQQLIDRRFYRSKYDAAKIIEAFSATLRHEVDLSQLSEQLLAVVQETMQPTCVSLWLRPPEHDGTHRAPWRATPPVSSEGR